MEQGYEMQCTRPHTTEYHKGGKSVPCGYCPACKYNERVGWTFRISEEARHSKEAWFITVTYDQEKLPIIDHSTGELFRGTENLRSERRETLLKRDIYKFIASLKKNQYRLWAENKHLEKPKIKYYLVGEYGGKYGRPHYHLIIFNLWQNVAIETELEKIWQKGRIETEPANPALIHYITGYLFEKSDYIKGEQERPFMSCSNGLGKQYIEKNKAYHKAGLIPYIHFNGHKIGMPKYYKDRIFNDEEKQIIQSKIAEYQLENDNPPLLNETREQRGQNEYSIQYRNKKQK